MSTSSDAYRIVSPSSLHTAVALREEILALKKEKNHLSTSVKRVAAEVMIVHPPTQEELSRHKTMQEEKKAEQQERILSLRRQVQQQAAVLQSLMQKLQRDKKDLLRQKEGGGSLLTLLSPDVRRAGSVDSEKSPSGVTLKQCKEEERTLRLAQDLQEACRERTQIESQVAAMQAEVSYQRECRRKETARLLERAENAERNRDAVRKQLAVLKAVNDL